ncbi:MAG: hypothetical protein SFY69_09815 [Planctomycetota bacterium]|nr:hypothetical protein [Planctomycetota bacterium]
MSDELAAATDFPPEFEDTVQVEVFDLRLLSRLGLTPRATTPDEGRAALTGPLLYNDLPPALALAEAERPYAATRADIALVQRLVDRYDAIFGPPSADRTEQIATDLRSAADRWMSLANAGRFDPAAFRRYVETTPAEQTLAQQIGALERLLADMRKLGLTGVEYRMARARLLRVLSPASGVSVDDLGALVQPAQPGA